MQTGQLHTCVTSAQMCVSVPLSLISPRHLSRFNMDTPFHLFYLLLHHPFISLSSVSLSSHTWRLAWLLPVRWTSLNKRTRKEERLPDKSNEDTHTHNCTHQFPLQRPGRVTEGEGLVTPPLLGRAVSCRLCPLGPASTCVYVWM